MTHGSLFSGIGGFDLAAEWMGWENKFHCEINPFCKRVLNYYWPDAKSYDDIKTTDFTVWRGLIDVLTGGFPCQPFSTAGKRSGSDDDRFLWPETIRTLKEIKPTYAVFENVFGLTSILESACETEVELQAVKLFSEGDNGEEVGERISEVKRRTISIIIADLYEAGYCLPENEKGEPIVLCVPACAVNAPHRRDRIWFIAHSRHTGDTGRIQFKEGQQLGGGWEARNIITPLGGTSITPYSEGQQNIRHGQGGLHAEFTGINEQGVTPNSRLLGQKEREIQTAGFEQCGKGNDAHAKIKRLEERNGEPLQHGAYPTVERHSGLSRWQNFPTQPPVCSGDDELPRKLDGITFSKWRNESIKGYGNAVVPRLVYEIFKAIEQYEKNV